MPKVAGLILIVLMFARAAHAELSPQQLDYALRPLSSLDDSDDKNAMYMSLAYEASGELNMLNYELNYQRTWAPDLAIIFSPLPSGLLYHLHQHGDVDSAVSWHVVMNVFGPIVVSPQFNSYSRKRLSRTWDFEVQLEYGTSVPLNAEPALWSLGLGLSARKHLSRGFSLTPSVQVVTEDQILQQVYSQNTSTPTPKSTFTWAVPLVLAVDKQTVGGSHFGVEYTYIGLGLSNEFFTLVLKGYWQGTW